MHSGVTATDPKVVFLVAGVQKAATTALHHYLRLHPSLHLPETKELHFFDDETLDWNAPPYAKYHARFGDMSSGRMVGECTPIYTYWRPSIPRIHAFNPRIKLIVSLRDPVARAYSHWRMEVSRHAESLDFSRAIRDGRARVVADQEIDGQHRVFSYVERGFYAPQIERLRAHFPSNRILFLTRQDLLRRRESTLDAVCRFLEVPGFERCPPQEMLFSHAETRVGPPSSDDVRYLRDLFRDDLEIAESSIGRRIELEYP